MSKTMADHARAYRQRKAAKLERLAVLEGALRNHLEWLDGLQGFDWDEIVADGGITAWMVIQQEARTVQAPRARKALGDVG